MEETHVKDVYNQIADHFRVTRTYKWTWVNDFLNKTDTGSKILDVGCGSGRNMQHENRNFTGIDNSLVFVEMCRGKGLNAHLMDMCKTTFKDKVFDYTISCASFHHLATEERRLLALKEMKRVTKKLKNTQAQQADFYLQIYYQKTITLNFHRLIDCYQKK